MQFQRLWFSSLKDTYIYASLFHGIIVSVDVNSTVQHKQKDSMRVTSVGEFGIYFIT